MVGLRRHHIIVSTFSSVLTIRRSGPDTLEQFVLIHADYMLLSKQVKDCRANPLAQECEVDLRCQLCDKSGE
jgi:hypothetical protein